MIATGLGLAAFDPLSDGEPAKKFGAGAAIGWSLCALVALFFGGWLAGRFNGGNRLTGGLHGFLVWSVAMVTTFSLIALGSGMALGGMATIAGASAKGGGKALAGATDLAKEGVKRNGDQLSSFLDEAMASRPAGAASNMNIRAKREVGFALGRFFIADGDANSTEKRAALIKALTAEGGMSEAEANKLIASWTASYATLKTDLAEAKAAAEIKAREAADVAARKLSKAAILSFIAFWIGAMIASWGGVLGSKAAYDVLNVHSRESIPSEERSRAGPSTVPPTSKYA
jgi:hypothetical protein